MEPVMLKHLVERYRKDKQLLEAHPENKELLERRIKQHEIDIVKYVTSNKFQVQISYLNL